MTTFRIRRRDGPGHTEVPASEVVHNAAFEYLSTHPTATGTICAFGARCVNLEGCRYVHLIDEAVTVPSSTPNCKVCESPVDWALKCRACPYATCSACLSTYVKDGWRASIGVGKPPALGCLNCAHPIGTERAARLLSAAAFAVYFEEQLRFASLALLGAAQRALEGSEGSVARALDVVLGMQLEHMMRGRAWMCPRCHFGPIDFGGCSDLTRHHGETRSGATVSNACPHCEFFAESISEWHSWDGVARSAADLLIPGRVEN